MSRILPLSAVFVSALAGTGATQDAAAWRDSVARLTTEYQAIRDSLVARDSTVVEISRKNGVVLSATPHEVSGAARAFEYFTEQRARWFGGALPSPGGFRLVVQTTQGRDIFARFGDGNRWDGTVILTGLPDTADAVRAQHAAEVKDLGNQLVAGFSEMMFPTLGLPTTRWLVDPPPLHMADRDRRYLAMYMVMTSTGKAERGCVDGNLNFCGYALGLRVAPSSDLTGAYPELVRADLFLTALEIGGPDAWSRIVAAHPVRAEEMLVAASGLAADSLLTRWRNGIIALRPQQGPLQSSTALLVACWVGALLLGTLGASRWR
jgi:hypothetical protein